MGRPLLYVLCPRRSIWRPNKTKWARPAVAGSPWDATLGPIDKWQDCTPCRVNPPASSYCREACTACTRDTTATGLGKYRVHGPARRGHMARCPPRTASFRHDLRLIVPERPGRGQDREDELRRPRSTFHVPCYAQPGTTATLFLSAAAVGLPSSRRCR